MAAIEVYPAATLIAHGHAPAGYKVPGSPARAAIVSVLAGADFLAGAARSPDDLELARREGWIWVRG